MKVQAHGTQNWIRISGNKFNSKSTDYVSFTNVVRREIMHFFPNCRQGYCVLLSSDAATGQSKKYSLSD